MNAMGEVMKNMLDNMHPKARYVSWPVDSVKNGRGQEVFVRRGRWIWTKGSKYVPHQGDRECARRRKQINTT